MLRRPGRDETPCDIYRSLQKRGDTTRWTREHIQHCQMIKPVIGCLNPDGLLELNHLKGELTCRMNAVLSGGGHSLQLVRARQ